MKKELGATGVFEENNSLSLNQINYLRYVENESILEVDKKLSVSQYLSNFKDITPKGTQQMEKQGKDLIPEDYKDPLKEIAELKRQLSEETLRAYFYEEMVVYAKEIYGIDLKKAGAK